MQDYGYSHSDGPEIPHFRKEICSLPPAEGRLLTQLTSGVSHHTYFENKYENGPAPGALMLPDAWIGSY